MTDPITPVVAPIVEPVAAATGAVVQDVATASGFSVKQVVVILVLSVATLGFAALYFKQKAKKNEPV